MHGTRLTSTVGLMLVEPLKMDSANVRFHVVLEDDAEILSSDGLHVEVSRDGYRWVRQVHLAAG